MGRDRREPTWRVLVEIPQRVVDEHGDGLFTAVADAVTDWEPDDRDSWDAQVVAGPEPRLLPPTRFADIDKAWRCPLDVCSGSMAGAWEREYDEGKRSWYRFHRCPRCRVLVLPPVLCWLQPSYWRLRVWHACWAVRDWWSG